MRTVFSGCLRKTFLILSLALLAGAALAMPPPSDLELDRYRRDGSLEQRIENAEKFGGHKIRKDLLDKANLKLRRALGLPVPLMAPPPSDKGMPTTGTVRIVVFCVAFADYPPFASNTTEVIDEKLFGNGDPGDYPYESLRNFYVRSSYDQLHIEGDVLGWYTTPYNRDQVASEGALMKELFIYYDRQGHDFAQYDNDGDGKIDYFMVIWTGPNTGWGSDWWAHMWSFENWDTSFYVDGKTLDSYSWNWESRYSTWYGAPGEFDQHVTIHETGHALGLPDYYDYDNSIGPPGGLGGLDMMDSNLGDHNSFSKFVLDWLTPAVYSSGNHSAVSLSALNVLPQAAVVIPEITTGDIFQEYFIVDNRNQSGNDTDHPGEGLLIWHVDARLTSDGQGYLYDNSWTEHKLLRLMEADGLEEIEQGYNADYYDYYSSGGQFGPTTTPDNFRYDASPSGFLLHDTSAPGSSMTFSVTYDSSPPSDVAWVYDGAAEDVDTATSGTSLSANWAAASDSESGVRAYFFAIGTSPGATDTLDWTSAGTATSATNSNLALASGTTYFFSVKAKNGAGLFSSIASSDGALVSISDPSPPDAVNYVLDGTGGDDRDFSSSTSTLSANWGDAYDPDTGVARYWFAAGTAPGATDVAGWTDNGPGTSATLSGLSLSHGQSYFFSVMAENGAALLSGPVDSDGLLVDTSPPDPVTTVNDGPGDDIDATSWVSRLYANWSAASDPESGIANYWFAIGTATDQTNVTGWIDAGTATSTVKNELPLIHGTTYCFSVKAQNGAGLLSNPATSDCQVFLMDESPPAPPPFVRDGAGEDIDSADSNLELSANWDTSSDPDSGIERYLYAVGSSPGATDVVYWTDAGLATGVTASGFAPLLDQQSYFFSVKAENFAGLASTATVSDGQTVDVFYLAAVAQTASDSVDVTFSRDVSTSPTVIDTANYSLDKGVGAPAAAQVLSDGRTVRLSFSPLAECNEYELTLSGIQTSDGKELMPGASPAAVSMLGSFFYSAINTDYVWTSAGSPYCIMDDVSINSEASVSVNEGARILFSPNQDADMGIPNAADLLVFGELIISGTPENPVTVSSAAASPAAGDWGGITFYSGASLDSRVSNAILEYGVYPVYVLGAAPAIADNSFSNCDYECVYVDAGGPEISGNRFSCSASDNYCLKTKTSLPLDIRDNSFSGGYRGVMLMSPATFTGNDINGMSDVALGVSSGAGGLLILENNFRNSGYGVYSWLDGSDIDLSFNYLAGNATDTEYYCPLSGCSLSWYYLLNDPVDYGLESETLSLFKDSAYTQEAGASVIPHASLFVQADGAGPGSAEANGALARVSSDTTDPTGIYLQLAETEEDSNCYRATLKTADSSDQDLYTIGATQGERITVQLVRNPALSASVSILPDTTPPEDVAEVIDGLGLDLATSTARTQIKARWSASSDPESGVVSYWYAVGTAPGATDTLDWTDNSAGVFFSRSGLDLSFGTTYYTSVKAENGYGLLSGSVSSNGVTIIDPADSTPPSDVAAATAAILLDTATSPVTFLLSATWTASADPESAIDTYWYSVGTAPGATDTLDWTTSGLSLSFARSDLPLSWGAAYFVSVTAQNGAGLLSSPTSGSGVTLENPDDSTPPDDVTLVAANLIANLAASPISFQLSASWSPSSDPESGVVRYWYSVGTATGATDTLDWTDNAAALSFSRSDLPLATGTSYFTSVKAENSAGLFSNPASSNAVSVNIQADTSPPSDVAWVLDGPDGPDLDISTSSTRIDASWASSSDPESGVARYWYSVGTAPGATDTLDWTNNADALSFSRSDVNLADGTTYYTSVKAENGEGLFSNPVSSDGLTVATVTLPTGPAIAAGWNLAGVSRENVSFRTDLFFSSASGTFEIFSFDGARYTPLTDETTQEFQAAAAYWIYSETGRDELDLDGTAATGTTFTRNLAAGWNAFSLPFEAAAYWGDSLAALDCGGPAPPALPPVYRYYGGAYTEIRPGDTSEILLPWTGYWIYSAAACTLSLSRP